MMNNSGSKKRIEYVDLMKGVCIFLIVLHHSGLTDNLGRFTYMTDNMRLPLYYFVAGLFVSDKRTPIQFTINKINRLIIPFAFFNFLWITLVSAADTSMMTKYLDGKEFLRGMISAANGPTWFLISLFDSYIIYYIFLRTAGKLKIPLQAIIVAAIAAAGVYAGNLLAGNSNASIYTYIIYNTRIVNGLIALPFIWLGSLLTRKGMLSYSPSLKIRSIILCIGLVLWIACSTGINLYSAYIWGEPPLLHYIAALGGISVVWAICQWIGRVPFLSFIGRYSIIVLGTHDVIITCLQSTAARTSPLLISFIVLILSPALIELIIALMPHLSAQKDLIPEVKNKKKHKNEEKLA